MPALSFFLGGRHRRLGFITNKRNAPHAARRNHSRAERAQGVGNAMAHHHLALGRKVTGRGNDANASRGETENGAGEAVKFYGAVDFFATRLRNSLMGGSSGRFSGIVAPLSAIAFLTRFADFLIRRNRSLFATNFISRNNFGSQIHLEIVCR